MTAKRTNVAGTPRPSQTGERTAPAPTDFEKSRDFVQSLARGLSVLRGVSAGAGASATLPQVAARAGLSRAATRRLVLTLEHLGYLRANGREYALTPRVLELGYGFLGSRNVTDLAQPYMEQLAHRVNESCSMAVLDGHNIVYVARVPVRKVMTVTLAVGARLPAFCTSMGRALLSGLAAPDLSSWLARLEPVARTDLTVVDRERIADIVAGVQRDGHAWVEQELEVGLCSLATPVRDGDGRVVAALNLGMPYRPDARRRAMSEMLPELSRTARAIEAVLPPAWLPPVSA
jgi:IclR family pca regulon transcriptional regulator